jgi:hypothetical protein
MNFSVSCQDLLEANQLDGSQPTINLTGFDDSLLTQTDSLSQPAKISFEAATGKVSVNFSTDPDFHDHELELFRRVGLENLWPGFDEFFNAVPGDSTNGHLVSIEGATLGRSTDQNDGNEGVYASNAFNREDLVGGRNNNEYSDPILSGQELTIFETESESINLESAVLPIEATPEVETTTLEDGSISVESTTEIEELGFVETAPEIVPFIPEPDMILTPLVLEDAEQVASISEPDPAFEATSLEGVGEAVQPPAEDSSVSSANEQILFDVAEMKPEPKGLDGIFNGIGDFTKSKYGLNISYNPSPTIAAAADGTWDRTIADFDVTTFVRDVAKTGAGYVIFSVGQTTGYYAAPNNAYLKYTETELGQYVPQRDLVKEIAQGLKKIGVATLVYVAAEGPTAAPAKIINNFPVRSDRAEDPEFRTEFNQVIQEWSERWGDDVVGWWLDGAWVDGYTNPIDGQANLNALIEAAKAGNPEAIVAANPATGKSNILSDRQDFLAGENTSFTEYPSESPYLAAAAADSNVPAWHAMSYLGNTWGDSSADRYSSQELIDYIQAVNRGSGVVTMDVGVSANGDLSDLQVAQLEAVKAEIRVS